MKRTSARYVCSVSLFLLSTLWAAAIVAAPHAGELAGRQPAWRHTLAASSTFVYLTGSFICHQRSDRSFLAAGAQYPVCARCTGLYVAAPFGILAALLTRRAFTLGEWRLLLSLAAIPTVVSILVERIGGPTGLASRALAALPLGAAAAAFVAVAILGHFALRSGRITGPQPRV
jgi:uncharacterized membrane protein